MTPQQFRRLALSLPEAEERSHMDHPDFRVRGKIFATLAADNTWGMVRLTPDEQAMLCRAEPDVFEPFAGAWGARGATQVNLKAARTATVREALEAAWRNTAPRALIQDFDEKSGT